MVIREQEPLNREYPFRTLDGPITPNNQFFIRTRLEWRKRIFGTGNN
jgi:hypothetical protein